MPAQYRSDGATATVRTYDNVKLKLFYSSNKQNAALAAAPAITNIAATLAGNDVTFQATVTGDPSAGIDSVWVTWTGAGSGGHDSWQSINLNPVNDNPNLYTATMPLPSGASAGNIRFIVQAANGVGLVTASDNLGAYNRLYDASVASLDRPDRGRSAGRDAAVGRDGRVRQRQREAQEQRLAARRQDGHVLASAPTRRRASPAPTASRTRPCRCRRRPAPSCSRRASPGTRASGPAAPRRRSRSTRPGPALAISGPVERAGRNAERRDGPAEVRDDAALVQDGLVRPDRAVDRDGRRRYESRRRRLARQRAERRRPVHDHGLLLEA